jgi:hypothetical protein
VHDDQAKVGYRLDLWNVLQACLDAPAQPVADAGGVTAADREAAVKAARETDYTDVCIARMKQGLYDHFPFVQAFARHRLQSVAAATAAKDAEIARLRETMAAIKAEASAATSSDGKERDPWAICRIAKWSGAALSEAREAVTGRDGPQPLVIN